jgi:hypothetical protein
MQDVQDLLSVMWRTFKAAEELFQALARVQVDTDHLNAYLNAVYPTPSSERNGSKRPERWERIEELFENGDAPELAPSHTLWGAYNAVTRYEDYRQANEAGPDRRLNRVWFGQGADLKLRALNAADTLCRQWVN